MRMGAFLFSSVSIELLDEIVGPGIQVSLPVEARIDLPPSVVAKTVKGILRGGDVNQFLQKFWHGMLLIKKSCARVGDQFRNAGYCRRKH
jgi:hypothetical protein